MSETTEVDTGEQSRLKRYTGGRILRYGRVSVAMIIGLAINAAVVSALATGGVADNLMGMGRGIILLIPALIIAAVMYDRRAQNRDLEPDHIAIRAFHGVILFAILGVANLVTLLVKVGQMGLLGSGLALVVVAIVAILFTPGPAIGVYAARRWWV